MTKKGIKYYSEVLSSFVVLNDSISVVQRLCSMGPFRCSLIPKKNKEEDLSVFWHMRPFFYRLIRFIWIKEWLPDRKEEVRDSWKWRENPKERKSTALSLWQLTVNEIERVEVEANVVCHHPSDWNGHSPYPVLSLCFLLLFLAKCLSVYSPALSFLITKFVPDVVKEEWVTDAISKRLCFFFFKKRMCIGAFAFPFPGVWSHFLRPP